ncbi:bifunctional 4-hydroxy-2-oxoglutarate aldolase/2-dehydro-3-deoxy-phosphogluconate aldolase [Micromonospora sp. CPCC 206060]|uniref:bifunctional 4-hydroxy-2-oxoglutarate aldolase/2-dehydro-3-deoxy-phosphogluconate aldolase n=1 Tax=Micromonospora sp. CPCC 206060 TaxID=3122406 RepID=UPI002FF19F45
MKTLDELFGSTRVMAILRGYDPDRTVALATAAWDLGVTALEVPIGEPGQLPALTAAVAAGARRGLAVGAGTVVTPEQVTAAAAAGAAYTVAPGFDPEVLAASLHAGLPHLPGVATPTEAQRALRAGCHWAKAFPASALGPEWIAGVLGPFPRLRIVATGGVRPGDAPGYLAAGAAMVALGAALADPAALPALRPLLPST